MLAQTITVTAMAKGKAAQVSTLTLVKGALKFMAWTQMKTALVAGAAILLATGTGVVAVKEIHDHQTDAWQGLRSFKPPWSFDKLPRQVKILPAKKHPPMSAYENTADGRMIGLRASVSEMVAAAFHFQMSDRIVGLAGLPDRQYDFIATLPAGSGVGLQREIQRQFGLAGRFEMIHTNALSLRIKNPHAAGLKPVVSQNSFTSVASGELFAHNQQFADLARALETSYFHLPVVDETGSTGHFDFKVTWHDAQGGFHDLEELKRALLDQLGLELVATNLPVEMLVISPAR